MNNLRKFASLAILCVAAHGGTQAQITTIGPFQGIWTEDWESFPTYGVAGPLPNPTAIMGGLAWVANRSLVVYQPFPPSRFGLGDDIDAEVHDGTKGMGMDTSYYARPDTATITFLQPVYDFGAYWGSYLGRPTVAVEFLGTDGSVVGTTSFTYSLRGPLEWFGWHSDAPFKSLRYTGKAVVIDSLQAIPEPSAWALLVLAGGMSCLLGRRKGF